MKPAPKKRVKNYVNNADLLTQIRLSKEQDRMTEELGKMIIMLCERYASHPDYSNVYYGKEDMISFAIMTLTKVWRGFKEIEGQPPNPFSYFTQIARNAFYQYLNGEKNQKQIKDKMLANIIPDEILMDWYNSSSRGSSNDDMDQHEAYDDEFKEHVIISNVENDPEKIDIEKELDNTPEEIVEESTQDNGDEEDNEIERD